uniref:Microtubule-associated protein 4 n=1 Tax=Echeneis naucrates TaxID=173247 RepID=A0A665X421_ECHNA
MDLSLRDALGGGGVPGGAPAEALLKRDFMASLEKESYDDKVGETVSKSDYRPLVDGKDTKSGISQSKTKKVSKPTTKTTTLIAKYMAIHKIWGRSSETHATAVKPSSPW